MMHILLLSMSTANQYSGVDRFIDMLVGYLESHSSIQIIWADLVRSQWIQFPQKEQLSPRLCKLTLPLPLDRELIINKAYWATQYYEVVANLLIKSLGAFHPHIIHTQYFELMPTAQFIQKELGGKIISHIHYIPWKGYLGRNDDWFNKCYSTLHLDSNVIPIEELYSVNGEQATYLESDAIITVTNYARDFIAQICPSASTKTHVIPNGLELTGEAASRTGLNSPVRLLFVGGLTKSKGLTYILQAMRLVQRQGYDIELSVAGAEEVGHKQDTLRMLYPDIDFRFLGRLDYERLLQLYKACDIGLIPSLLEQCSYAALEMMMSGLPIITTAVDGLDELFIDEDNALKVPVIFTEELGLHFPIEILAEKIIRLINDPKLRYRLGRSARKHFERHYRIGLMGERILNLYRTLS